MKNLILSLLLFNILGYSSYAQNVHKLVKHAEDLVIKGDYFQAKLTYLEAYKLDSNDYQTNEELGLLLVEYFDDYDRGGKHIQKALEMSKQSDREGELHIFNARCLQFNGDFNAAMLEYTNCKKYIDDSNDGKLLNHTFDLNIENCKYAIANPNAKNRARYRIKNLGPEVNSKEADYSPVLVKDQSVLFFTSRRKENTGEKIDDIDLKYYEDMYVSYKRLGRFKSTDKFSAADNYIASIHNSQDHDAIVSVNDQGNILYLYKNNDLFQSFLNNNVWSSPVPFPAIINGAISKEAHAAITTDGKILYFSSDRPGGFGGLDIYKSVKDASGNWTEPVNLGERINTIDDEDSPFITKDGGTLYFSSKGMLGFGGYDIFKSSINKNEFSAPVNLGLPFNSNFDDIYFSMNHDETLGILASSRNGGYGDMDLYEIIYFDDDINAKCIPLTNQIKNEDLYLDFACKDSIFLNDSLVFDARDMKLKDAIVVRSFWKINDTLLLSDTLLYSKKFTKPGIYNLKLQVAILADSSYDRQDYCVSKSITVFEPKAVDDFFEPLVKKQEEKITIAGTMDIAKIAIDSAKVDVVKIKLDPIYFDTDKSVIRKDAIKTINENINKMKVDKNIIVKITAHTDTTASREYNLKLSQKRADATIAYLNKMGIKKDRIYAVVALGEEQIVKNDCGTDVKCKEQFNQRNRRVEFKIIGSGKSKAEVTKKKGKGKPVTKKNKK